MAALYEPDVFEYNAFLPKALLDRPLTMLNILLLPNAVFAFPETLFVNACQPNAVLYHPVVFAYKA